MSTTAGLPLAPESPDYIAPDVAGEPADILGGSSFADATPVTTGRFVGTIVPGETQMFRVPLDWGQAVRTRVLLPETSPALEQAMGTTQSPYLSWELFDPMHGQLDYHHTDDSSFANASSYAPDSLRMMTEAVRYLDRDEIGERAVLPGDHYLSLAAAEDEDGRTYSLPYVLEIEVVGEPAGEPAYTVAALAPDAPGSGLRSDLPALAGTPDPEESASTEEPIESPDVTEEDLEGDPAAEETADAEPVVAAGAEATGRVRQPEDQGILDDPVTLTSVTAGGAGLALVLATVVAVLVARPRWRP